MVREGERSLMVRGCICCPTKQIWWWGTTATPLLHTERLVEDGEVVNGFEMMSDMRQNNLKPRRDESMNTRTHNYCNYRYNCVLTSNPVVLGVRT